MTETLDKPAAASRIRKARPAKSAPDAPSGRVRTPGKAVLIVGGIPRADLLPVEVLVHRRQRATVRRAWLGVVVVAAVVALGVAVSAMDSASSATQLRSAQDEGTALLQQQGQYSEVRKVESRTALAEAAQTVGGAPEIDWSTYLTKAQGSLPEGVSIVGVTVDSASPLESYDQPTTPLQGARVATLTFEADSPTLPSIPDWLDRVRGLPGFVDANANSVTLDSNTGHYTVDMTVHINQQAFDGKYSEKTK
ncbi:hypothetical protein DEJ28_16965 [Curtobacterium sp. MCPF17_002]|uniref:hypothetical protein n=1 Tax=Curtobacterium sp. MCPF17_002 TaxID=2175645 RepID=UPI0024DFFC18|nr:hypothetical protein [Curtobacterium sp. MCPF17_002]WIB77312.1 hypothetical protein DEJ28_16965 [Curtobacterium sp. MCPF17_002]